MACIRVLIGGVPQLLHEIIAATLSAEKGIRVVSAAPGETVLDVLARTPVDAVVVDLAGPYGPAEIDEILAVHPRLRLFGIADGGRSGFLFELRPHREALGELSPRQLVSVIRRPGHVRASNHRPQARGDG